MVHKMSGISILEICIITINFINILKVLDMIFCLKYFYYSEAGVWLLTLYA